jgi:hypothetical protein
MWTYNEDDSNHFAYAVFNSEKRHFNGYSNYDFWTHLGDDGLTIEQFSLWDSRTFTERESILSHYRN